MLLKALTFACILFNHVLSSGTGDKSASPKSQPSSTTTTTTTSSSSFVPSSNPTLSSSSSTSTVSVEPSTATPSATEEAPQRSMLVRDVEGEEDDLCKKYHGVFSRISDMTKKLDYLVYLIGKEDPKVTIRVLEKIFGEKYNDLGDYILPMLSNTRYHKIIKLILEYWMKVTKSSEIESLEIFEAFVHSTNIEIARKKRFELIPSFISLSFFAVKNLTNESCKKSAIYYFLQQISKIFLVYLPVQKAHDVGVPYLTYMMSRKEISPEMIARFLLEQLPIQNLIFVKKTILGLVSKEDISIAIGLAGYKGQKDTLRKLLEPEVAILETREQAIRYYFYSNKKLHAIKKDLMEKLKVHLPEVLAKIVLFYHMMKYQYGQDIAERIDIDQILSEKELLELTSYSDY